jgi:maltose/moltooligosaccharide transporter
MENKSKLPMLTTAQLLNLCIGFFGLQFAWQMRIILSGPVTEALGASPFIFSLIWLAGPITGLIVQPIVGAISDSLGSRKPFLLAGAILASLALWGFPFSQNIVEFFSKITHINTPIWSALLVAAIFIWIIDASVNAAQGPYRALIPDIAPEEQHSIANSYISFAIGLGSVIAAGTAPFLSAFFNYKMDINAQFIMAALAFTLGMLWTCTMIKERKSEKKQDIKQEQMSFFDSLKSFFSASPEIYKICAVQFFTWIGIMSMFIYFTQFAVHNVFGVPDLAGATDAVKASFANAKTQGELFSGASFTWFNLVCFIFAIPIGVLASKFGNRKIHMLALISMGAAFIGMTFTTNATIITALMALAGIGWASTLALPFAMLSEFIKKGTEGSVMGIFNIFIAGPQVLVCTVLGYIIMKSPIKGDVLNYHWEYAFLIGGASILIAAVMTKMIKKKQA